MISVIIPVYNEEKIIGEAIDEIIKVMKKNKLDKESEIIVVNDGSTDNTKEEISKKSTKHGLWIFIKKRNNVCKK